MPNDLRPERELDLERDAHALLSPAPDDPCLEACDDPEDRRTFVVRRWISWLGSCS